MGDKCPRSHSKWGHGRSGKNKDKTQPQPSEIPCRHFLRGRCNLGDKCKFSHKGKPKATSGSNGDSKHNPLNRCKADLSDKKCPFGMKCWHAHRSSVNQRKDADKDISDKVAKAKQVCRCCGRKGHTAQECNKLKAHLQDIKDAVGYTGNIVWFDDDNNAKRCQDLFKQNREWRLATSDKQPIKKGTQPFKLEANWIDGGWCTIGAGKHKREVRLQLDLGAPRSFGSRSLFKSIAKDIREGNLGAHDWARTS